MTLCQAIVTALLVLAPLAAQAQHDDKKLRPLCRMTDSDVHLTADD